MVGSSVVDQNGCRLGKGEGRRHGELMSDCNHLLSRGLWIPWAIEHHIFRLHSFLTCLMKFAGFAELEYGALRYMGAVDDSTLVVTTVHDCQVSVCVCPVYMLFLLHILELQT